MGSSCYPAWGATHNWDDDHPESGKPFDRHTALLNEMWNNVALRFDYIRSCNKRGNPIWAAEFQGGPVSTDLHKGRVPSAEDIRRWMLTAIGSGVTAISFWVTRAEIMAPEMNGFSLLDSEGDSTERFEEASHVGKALQKYPDLFAHSSWPGAKAAILINESNYRVCNSIPQGSEHLTYSVRGWHRLLWEIGIPVDFIEVSELDKEYINRYKVIILPFPISLSESIASNLARYVKEGGNLISEACPGRLNEYGFCNRGELSPTARELFGVQQKNLAMVREPENGTRWSPRERTWGEYLDETMLIGVGPLESKKIRANLYIESFECLNSKPCLLYGKATAGTVRKVDKGRAWILGTFVGHNGMAYRDKKSKAFIQSLLRQCDVVPEHNGNLLLRKRIIKGKEAWIFTNPTEKDVTEKIDVRGWNKVEDLFGDELEQEDGYVNLTVKSLDVKVLILKK